MKKITFLFIAFLGLSFSPNAQNHIGSTSSDSSQHFLWFSGHWSKTKKNTFITAATSENIGGTEMKMGGGSTINISPGGSVTIQSPGIDNWNKKIDDGEKDLDKTINEMKSSSNEIQEWSHHFNEVTLTHLDTMKAQWTRLKINKKENPLNQQDQNDQRVKRFIADLSQGCKNMKPQYQAIIDYYNTHLNDESSDYHNPAPPEFDFTCSVCDNNLEKEHEKRINDYANNFFKPESELLRNGFAMLRNLILLDRANDLDNTPVNFIWDNGVKDKINQAFHIDKSDPSKSGACAYYNNDQLNKAIKFLIMRMYKRADKLLQDNKNNFKTATAVCKTFMAAARNCELLGFTVNENTPELLALLKKAYDYYFNRLTQDHDWSQVANIPVLFGLARNYLLLGGNENDIDISKLFKVLNSFHINIEMDIKIGKGNGYYLAHLKGKAKIAPEFHYGPDSCYQWVIIDDKPNEIGEPVKKGDQKINVDLLDNEVVTKDRPIYTGTKKYWCTLSQLKMDYCHPGKDTILLTGFIPDPPMGGTWQYPGIVVPAAINGLDEYFRDFNKMKELAQSGAVKSQAEKMKVQAEKLAQQMKSMQGKMGSIHDPSQIGNYQKIMEMVNQTREMTNNQNLAPVMYIDFPLQIQNNNTILVKKRFDAKEINPKMAEVIVYGYYTVDIEYEK